MSGVQDVAAAEEGPTISFPMFFLTEHRLKIRNIARLVTFGATAVAERERRKRISLHISCSHRSYQSLFAHLWELYQHCGCDPPFSQFLIRKCEAIRGSPACAIGVQLQYPLDALLGPVLP